MNTSTRPSLREFLTKSKKGRMILLAAFMGGILVLVPTVLGRKRAPSDPAQARTRHRLATRPAREAISPPPPPGSGIRSRSDKNTMP